MDVKSYIKIPNVLMTDDFMSRPEDFFVDIDDAERLKVIADKLDINYIEGAIVVSLHGNNILDYSLWDLVGATWAYLMNAIEEFLEKGKSHMYFPDQPIRIEMEEKGRGHIKLVIGNGEYGSHVLPREELFNALINGAEHFFWIIKKEMETDKFDFHLEQIKSIKRNL